LLFRDTEGEEDVAVLRSARCFFLLCGAGLLLIGCAADAGSGEDVESSDEALLAGRKLSPSEVASLLRGAGFRESVIPEMVCTAKYESSYYAGAQNRNTNGSTDYGLFQINDRYWLRPCGVTRQQLLDPATNARCAKRVFDEQGLDAWYGYKAHRSECDRFVVPGDGAGGAGGGDGCYSATLHARVGEGECVESSSNGLDYQCSDGAWYRIAGSSGPAGRCTEHHRL
jgi:lysozyme C